MKHCRRLLTYSLTVLCLLSALASSALAVSGTERMTIRVGVSAYPEYAYYDSDGRCAGAAVEYLYRIAEYADVDVEVKLIKDAKSYFQALDNGDVDMLFDVVKTPQREEKYLFAEYESGSTPQSIYVRKDDIRFSYGNLEQLKDMTFATESGSYLTRLFKSWCQQRGFTPSIREFSDIDAMNAALTAHQVDACVYGVSAAQGYRTILQFAPKPYYAAFRADESALKNRIDDAMGCLLAEEPLYKERMMEIFSSTGSSDMDVYSRQEKIYISKHPTVTVAVLKGDAPYFSYGTDGSPKGILPDYYTQLASLVGVDFQFAAYSSQQEAIDAIHEGKADVLGMFSNGLVSAHASSLRLTNAYSTVNAVLLTRAGTDRSSIHKIAVKSRSRGIIQLGIDTDIHASLVTYDNAQSCFDAMNRGEVDGMISGLPSITWLVNQTNAAAYSISPQSGIDMNLCGAVNADNELLWSILNKGIRASHYSFNGIVARDTLSENSWRTTIARIPPLWTAIFAGVMIASILLLVLTVISLTRRQREMAAIAREREENSTRHTELLAIEKSNEERNRFFSNISHDMRTPLNAIIGFSNLAQQKAISPEVGDYLSKIHASGNLLLELINDTLTISKISSGKIQLSLQPVSTQEMTQEIIIPIRAAAEQKRITFSVVNSVPPKVVLADKLNVQKIFLNLLSNSVKYTPEGGRVVWEIHDAPEGGESPDTIFVVRDNGIGISDSFLPHIYEPFAQQRQTGEHSSGTGLGLSIVRQLVELMGGTISVETQEYRGTAFTVRLHFDEVSGVSPSGSPDEPEHPADSLSGKNVLLCEDNALNREIACALLSSWGMNVVAAENGQAGLSAFSAREPWYFSAVLMDLRMPLMDGYEATAAIRALHRPDAAAIPILAMTADAFDDDVQKCMAAGMNGHISKPLDPELLRRQLSEAIAKV